ncbi:hypothetical protein PQX77_016825 [Marasmius sp. AFHP31]|nr:hypothetical protein PQX77_016825 [Marasmius sp. AFHP31]
MASSAAFIQTFPPEATTSIKCYLGRASNIGLVCYMSLLAGETVIVLMTIWKAYSTWRTTTRNVPFKTSPLIVSFYRDGIGSSSTISKVNLYTHNILATGILFYCCVLPFTIINVIALLGLPEGLLLIADTPLRVVHSILACRLVIHVRHIADTERETFDIAMESVRFLRGIEDSEMQGGSSRRSLQQM